MTNEQYHATLRECLAKVWDAQLKLEAAFDALAECHVSIRAAIGNDRITDVLNAIKGSK